MTKTANFNFFKKFGNAATTAFALYNIEMALANVKDAETRKSLVSVAEKIFEACEWRKAFNDEAGKTWVGTRVFNLIQKAVERGFKYLTLDEIICDTETVQFLALLDELNITEFVFADNSTACLRNLIAFTNNGWRVAGSVEQVWVRHNETRTENGLRIVKAKKN